MATPQLRSRARSFLRETLWARLSSSMSRMSSVLLRVRDGQGCLRRKSEALT